MKTDYDLGMKEYRLEDLETEMQEQLYSLKIQKRLRNIEPELKAIFNSITRNNPPKINKINPKYAIFSGLKD